MQNVVYLKEHKEKLEYKDIENKLDDLKTLLILLKENPFFPENKFILKRLDNLLWKIKNFDISIENIKILEEEIITILSLFDDEIIEKYEIYKNKLLLKLEEELEVLKHSNKNSNRINEILSITKQLWYLNLNTALKNLRRFKKENPEEEKIFEYLVKFLNISRKIKIILENN